MKYSNMMSLLKLLKKTSIENDVKIWKRIASDLEKATKKRRIVNISKINKFCKNNETIIVPGKVLGLGKLDKKLTIAAYNFSREAYNKIKSSGSTGISISELVKKNPKGKKVRIIG